MNCQEALNLLYDIIDKEASEIDTQQVQEHLSRCRHCSEIYKVEKSVNALLKAKMQASSPAPCVDALKLRVLNELDAVDGDLHHHHQDSGETKGRALAADTAWHAALCEGVRGAVPLSTAPLAHATHLLEDAAAKAELLARLGACAADMESAAVAAVALESGVPFLAVRVVLDDAGTVLPAGVARSFGGTEPSPGPLLLWRLALDPGCWSGTMDLARAARVAGRSMRTLWSLAGPDLRLGMTLRAAGGPSVSARHAHGAPGP